MDHGHHSVKQLTFYEKLNDAFSQYGFMPHGHCYLWKPLLVSIHVISDFLIGIAYLSISLILYGLIKKIHLTFNRVVLCFGVFIGACGLTHFMEIWNLWHADYWWGAWVKVITAIASVGTGVYLYRLRHAIVQVAEAAKLAEERRIDLEALTTDLEYRVKERTRELQAALISRDEFLSIASHELKTPLTSLLLQAQMLKRLSAKNDPETYEKGRIDSFINQTEKLTSRLNVIVDDMLDISKIRSGRMNYNKIRTELCSLVEDTIERLAPQFQQAGYLKPTYRGEQIYGEWDPIRIEQVIYNLLSNAIRYGQQKEIEVYVVRRNDEALITVKDHGIGIAKEKQNKIFEKFERAIDHNEVSGLGLGLFISSQIVLAHGGKIWVESELGYGSTFHVALPL